ERIGAHGGQVVQRLRRVGVVDERGQQRLEELRRQPRAHELAVAGVRAVERKHGIRVERGLDLRPRRTRYASLFHARAPRLRRATYYTPAAVRAVSFRRVRRVLLRAAQTGGEGR